MQDYLKRSQDKKAGISDLGVSLMAWGYLQGTILLALHDVKIVAVVPASHFFFFMTMQRWLWERREECNLLLYSVWIWWWMPEGPTDAEISWSVAIQTKTKMRGFGHVNQTWDRETEKVPSTAVSWEDTISLVHQLLGGVGRPVHCLWR